MISNIHDVKSSADYSRNMLAVNNKSREGQEHQTMTDEPPSPYKRTAFDGNVLRVNIERVTLPNAVTCDVEIIHHPGGAAAVALDDRERVCLVHQFRHAAGGWLWELPAGKIDDGDPHAETAERELREEAGVMAAQWDYLGAMVSSPGVFTERVHLYLARQLELGTPEQEAEEVLEVHWLPLDEALVMAADGRIIDAKSVIGLWRAARALEQ